MAPQKSSARAGIALAFGAGAGVVVPRVPIRFGLVRALVAGLAQISALIPAALLAPASGTLAALLAATDFADLASALLIGREVEAFEGVSDEEISM